MKRKGVGLGSTLLVVTIVAMLGFALASASVTHLNLMARDGNAALALDRARSAIDLTLAHLYTDPDFGKNNESVTSPGPEQSLGELTFNPAGQADLGPSLNNLTGSGSVVAPDGQLVPREGIYLQAVGRARGVTRHVTAIVHVPPFPYAVATDGPLSVLGGLEVGTLKSGQNAATPIDQLDPADLLSNAGGLTAIDLGPRSNVRGSLKAVGGIRVAPGSTVGGKQLGGQQPTTVPNLQIAGFDPQTLGQSSAPLQPTYQTTTFTGAVRRDGDVKVDGDLTLSQALVFVKGDLDITGSVSGDGVLVATGNLTVGGQTQMQANNRVAMLSGGLLSLSGNGPSSSSVQGLLYAENGLSAQQVQVEGAIVARQSPAVNLADTRLLQNGQLLQAPFQIATIPPTGGQGPNLYSVSGGNVYTNAADAQRQGNPADGQFHSFELNQITLVAQPDGNYQLQFSTTQFTNNQQGVTSEVTKIDNLSTMDVDRALAYGQLTMPDGQVLTVPKVVDPQNIVYPDPLWVNGQPGTPGANGFPLSVDPSKLLPPEEQARTILWRQD